MAEPGEASLDDPPLRLLFICSRNQWRSPTAEAIFRKDVRLNVRSAGTASSARRKLKRSDLEWADLVLVMEPHHASQIRRAFRAEIDLPEIGVLDIPDDYQFMDPELVEILKTTVPPWLDFSY